MDRFFSNEFKTPLSRMDRNEDGSPYETFASADEPEVDYEVVEVPNFAVLAAIWDHQEELRAAAAEERAAIMARIDGSPRKPIAPMQGSLNFNQEVA